MLMKNYSATGPLMYSKLISAMKTLQDILKVHLMTYSHFCLDMMMELAWNIFISCFREKKLNTSTRSRERRKCSPRKTILISSWYRRPDPDNCMCIWQMLRARCVSKDLIPYAYWHYIVLPEADIDLRALSSPASVRVRVCPSTLCPCNSWSHVQARIIKFGRTFSFILLKVPIVF